MHGLSRTLLCITLSAIAACRPRVPTYHRDVEPILERHCRECHHEGGIAPVPTLRDYESARMYAEAIKYAVQSRRMPPWGADDTGLCGTWRGARWLTTDEIATIARWQEAGAREGPSRSSARPEAVARPFRADVSVDIGGIYKPGLGGGGNRCFVADPKLDRDRLLGAIRVVSTDPRAVAQVTLFALDSPAAEAEAVALDAADPALGYPCYGTARVADARPVAGWTWPTPVLRLPTGTGVRLYKQRKMVVQVHYDITQPGGEFAADTHIDLELDDDVREARVLRLAATGPLPPEQRYVAVERLFPIERPVRVVGVLPRMHIRGQVMHVTAERGSDTRCLATFDHWHFVDEQLYVAESAPRLDVNERIRLSCAYATLGRSKPMTFGDEIDQEECVAYLFVTDD